MPEFAIQMRVNCTIAGYTQLLGIIRRLAKGSRPKHSHAEESGGSRTFHGPDDCPGRGFQSIIALTWNTAAAGIHWPAGRELYWVCVLLWDRKGTEAQINLFHKNWKFLAFNTNCPTCSTLSTSSGGSGKTWEDTGGTLLNVCWCPESW